MRTKEKSYIRINTIKFLVQSSLSYVSQTVVCVQLYITYSKGYGIYMANMP